MPVVLNPELSSLKSLVENIDSHFGQSGESLHKARNEIRVVEYGGERFAVKAFRIPNPLHSVIYRFLRQSKAERSYRYSLELGVDFCPQAVAYTEEHTLAGLGRSFYISRHFEHDFTIRPLLRKPDFPDRKQILEEFARFTFRLHEKGVLHLDYSPGNILIRHRNGVSEFRIVDVNRMQFTKPFLEQRLANFNRLQPDDETLATILSVYAGLLGKPAEDIINRGKVLRDSYAARRARNQALKKRLRGG